MIECRRAVGDNPAVERLLQTAPWPKADENHVDVVLVQIERALAAGDLDRASDCLQRLAAADRQRPRIRWLEAEWHRRQGRVDRAAELYAALADLRTDAEQTPVADLLAIARGAAQHARWTRGTALFRRLVSQDYPQLLRRDPLLWEAHLDLARLYLEKFNAAAALEQLNAATAINSQAAAVHAERAHWDLQRYDLKSAERAVRRALRINPVELSAMLAEADLQLARFRPREAQSLLAAAVRTHPGSEEALGSWAASRQLVSAVEAEQLFQEARATALRRNPKCGRFFRAMGRTLELARRYPQAVQAYEEAHRRLPQLIDVQGRWGMNLMRLGDEREARKQLAAAFDGDPFNVRVKNSLAVLDLLDGYAVLESAHFVVRFDRGQETIFAEAVSRYLEQEAYPELVRELGFEPAGKTLVEIFSRSGNTSGHGWFSARTAGVPAVGTVAACVGKMIAMASPQEMPDKYPWANVLRHELVHVINMQQTDFHVPHWFTEGLAVSLENRPPPLDWKQAVVDAADQQRLFRLDDLNEGFLQPGGKQWVLAYAQAELYLEYLRERADGAIVEQMLAAFKARLDTPQALEHCLGIGAQEFEEGYDNFLKRRMAQWKVSPSRPAFRFAELQRRLQQEPDNPDRLAEFAAAHWERKSVDQAARLASQARSRQAAHPLATWVLARIALQNRDRAAARKLLSESLDQQQSDPRVLKLLGSLEVAEGKFAAAELLLLRGQQAFPSDPDWARLLSRVYVRTNEADKLESSLKQIVELDSASPPICLKLSQLAAARQDSRAAHDWANQAIYLDVMHAGAQAHLGELLQGEGRWKDAVARLETAVQLAPRQVDYQLALARACLGAEQTQRARRILDQLLAAHPDHTAARQLLETLKP